MVNSLRNFLQIIDYELEGNYMELKVRKVKLKSKDVKAIYFDSFPPNGRLPFCMMVVMSNFGIRNSSLL